MAEPCLFTARVADKRVQREDEYSDSEDEGEGGRKNQESHKKKRRKVEGGGEEKTTGNHNSRWIVNESFAKPKRELRNSAGEQSIAFDFLFRDDDVVAQNYL